MLPPLDINPVIPLATTARHAEEKTHVNLYRLWIRIKREHKTFSRSEIKLAIVGSKTTRRSEKAFCSS